MYKMFQEASSFNQPLNNWNVSNGKSQNRNDCLDFFLSMEKVRIGMTDSTFFICREVEVRIRSE